MCVAALKAAGVIDLEIVSRVIVFADFRHLPV
jgi:hypothetical protein